MFQIKAFTSEDRESWNAFNYKARCGHFLFDRDFMEYHADRFLDASLIILKNGVVCGLLPANRLDDMVFSHQGLSFGGLVHDAGAADVIAMMDAACETFRSRNVKKLIYKPIPFIYHARPAEEALYWLFRAGAQLVQREPSAAIAYANPVSFSSRRKRGCSRAIQAGLSFGETSDLASFWTVLAEVLEARHGVQPVHSLGEINKLAKRFPGNIRLFAAAREGTTLAGVLMFVNRSCAHAQYIASSPNGRDVGALDGLFRYIIDLFREEGCAYLDFGKSSEDEGTMLNQGLMTQKEEFGGTVICLDAYAVTL